MTEYRYESLQRPTSQIRILYLEAGAAAETIQCSLVAREIDKVHDKYEALSYTWGSADPRDSVVVDGRSIPVKPNLFSALQRLRRVDSERALWIDAVCINQADTPEKNAQVPLMRQIYRSASEVIVWLGEPQGFDAKAVFDLASAAENAEETHGTVIKLFDRHKKGVDDLREFFLLPYWTRVWIVQELALAHRCILLCGIYEGSWLGFSKLQRTIVRGRYELNAMREEFFVFGEKEDIIMNALPLAIESVRCPRYTEPNISLLEVLRRFRGSQCTDPRDKVIGFLGLIQSGLEPLVTVDYAVTPAATYIQSVEALLSDSGRLDFLSDCVSTSSNHLIVPESLVHSELTGPTELPSWVPNWTLASPLEHRSLNALSTKAPFRAGGDKVGYVYHQFGSITLSVRGIVVDEIAMISGVWNWSFDGPAVSETDDELVWQICAVDRNMDGSMYGRGSSNEKEYLRSDKPPSVMGEYLAPYGRRLFRGKGGEAGLAPLEVKIGDSVCVIWGCNVPIVLRKTSGGWLVVGEAYLHGYMDGQASSRRDLDDKIFTLL